MGMSLLLVLRDVGGEGGRYRVGKHQFFRYEASGGPTNRFIFGCTSVDRVIRTRGDLLLGSISVFRRLQAVYTGPGSRIPLTHASMPNPLEFLLILLKYPLRRPQELDGQTYSPEVALPRGAVTLPTLL